MFQKHLTVTCFQRHALLLLLSTAISTWHCSLANATNYYVSGKGSDTNNGLSTSTAFRTIQKAADLTQPGDTVFVMNGLYTNFWPKGDAVTINHSGSPSAWITYEAYPGNSPKLKFNGWSGFYVAGAAYIEINGFKIEGNNDSVTLNYALTQKSNLDNSITSGYGILVDGHTLNHHIRVVNNKVYKCGGAGIQFSHSDYVTVKNNKVYDNGWYSPNGNSDISLYQNANSDNNTGYKNYVINNVSYGNYNYIPFSITGTITDGNGIIIDDSKNTQNNSTYGVYTGKTLVANNLVFNNGGSGIHTYYSGHVDVINNTAYMNSQNPAINGGEIFAMESEDVNILNNILYSASGKKLTSNWNNSNVTYDYNIYFNSTDIAVLGPKDLQMQPQFVNPSTDSAFADFHLQSTSPAINSGTPNLAPKTDRDRNSRPLCGAYDRGAYEFTRCDQVK